MQEEMNNKKTPAWIYVLVAIAIALIAVVLLSRAKEKTPDDVMVEEPTQVISQAMVSGVTLEMQESFPVDVVAVITGDLSDGCTSIGDASQSFTDGVFNVNLQTTKPLSDEICTQALVPYTERVMISGTTGLPQGVYTVDVNGVTAEFEFIVDNIISDFDPQK